MVAALERLGCYSGRNNRGSHRTFCRRLPDGTVASAQVTLGQRELPRGTARDILRLLQISEADFDRALR